MSQAAKSRALIGHLAVVAIAALGATLGYLLGNGFAVIQATNWLNRASETAVTHDSAALSEARNVLHAMRVVSSGACSESEMARFRSLVFRSEYIKDAGRIRGGKIDCAVVFSEPARAIGRLRPDLRLEDGTLAYRNLPTADETDRKRVVLQQGSAYVVFGLALLHSPEPIPIQLAITMQPNGSSALVSPGTEASEAGAAFRTTEGSGRVGNELYSTRCSESNFDCVTTTTPVADAIHSQFGLLVTSSFAGAMAGILCGMGFSFVYCRRRELNCQLRRAVDRNELKVLYQPIVNMETRKIVGAEALARWTDEDNNAVDPELFVKAAEDLGFVGSITKQVLQCLLRDLGPTLQRYPGFHASLNVAASDLVDPDFVPMLRDALKNANVRPQNLVIEITERSAANSETAKETVRTLRRLGHSIHIDDFGAGYSNLDRLLYLYADTIKIDKAFTKTIGIESVAGLILPQIMNMAQSLNLEVIVEGIETTQQADYFSSTTKSIYGQGWLFGRPMSAAALRSELEDNPLISRSIPEGYEVFGMKAAGI
jgi:sensor c-di-GMP phosphodiesterase-like protein